MIFMGLMSRNHQALSGSQTPGIGQVVSPRDGLMVNMVALGNAIKVLT